ncbi:Rieske (2Fe-2S) protein [Amycolatopsis jejuensis]|uniref:Rieske (2Fe-2S) protein n=1 Tax=Amycolatopsis jejuensis TaxID=330084 RepID=UPI000526268F|nr:Rieske 2Fe-2S domain-containing protein [Amycolatopsis jejuensis]
MEHILVAPAAEIPEGGRLVVSVAEVEVAIFRLDGRLYGWRNHCLHAGGPVGQGLLVHRVVEEVDPRGVSRGEQFSGDLHVVCPWHGYEYNVRTGKHPGDPRLQLRSVAVREEAGQVFVDLPEAETDE